MRRAVGTLAVAVGAGTGLIGAATVLLWATAQIAQWFDRRWHRRMLGGAR